MSTEVKIENGTWAVYVDNVLITSKSEVGDVYTAESQNLDAMQKTAAAQLEAQRRIIFAPIDTQQILVNDLLSARESMAE
jgi:hypothetical protein